MKDFSVETRKKMSIAAKAKIITDEHRRNLSLARRGNKNPNYGKINTPEMRERQRLAQLGDRGHAYGKHPSPETLKKRSESMKGKNVGKNKGEKHWLWKGGITPIMEQIRKCYKYVYWRSSVLERDNYTCLWCGQIGGKLNADHIIPFSLIIEKLKFEQGVENLFEKALNFPLLWDINNGRTLCLSCHVKTSTYAGRASKNNKNKV